MSGLNHMGEFLLSADAISAAEVQDERQHFEKRHWIFPSSDIGLCTLSEVNS